jgi:hypothetical protein
MDLWMKSYPETRATIYNIPEIVVTVLYEAAKPKIYLIRICCCWNWPFIRNVFEETDFVPCDVTSRSSTDVQRNLISSFNYYVTSHPDKALGLLTAASTSKTTKPSDMTNKLIQCYY